MVLEIPQDETNLPYVFITSKFENNPENLVISFGFENQNAIVTTGGKNIAWVDGPHGGISQSNY